MIVKEVYKGYFVTKQGEVFSKVRKNIKKLAVTVQWSYPRVRVMIDGKETSRHIHRMVATAFIPNPENKEQVNHKDGNKLNCHVDNLEWVTRQENKDHAEDIGLLDNCPRVGVDNGRAILSESCVDDVVTMLLSGLSSVTVAKKYNISVSTVSNIIRGVAWKHIVLDRLDSIRKPRTYTDIDKAFVIKRIEEGLPMSRIASEIGVSPERIYTIRNNYIKAKRLSKDDLID